MALKIWCNPKAFPAETHGLAVATALEILAARGVTLRDVQVAQANIDQTIDFPQQHQEPPEGAVVYEWEDAWFAAIAAAAESVNLDGPTPIGSMLALDEHDDRFGTGRAS
jgi:hypothetical protein